MSRSSTRKSFGCCFSFESFSGVSWLHILSKGRGSSVSSNRLSVDLAVLCGRKGLSDESIGVLQDSARIFL